MSDKITKFLRKLSSRELDKISKIKDKITINNLNGMNVKKLSGHANLYRVRIGRIRIIFENIDKDTNSIKKIDFRDDKTYRDF